jgi:hypothetical protein
MIYFNKIFPLILLCNRGMASYIIWWWHIPYRQWTVYTILNINTQHRFGQMTTVYFMPSDNQFTIIMHEWAVQTWLNDYMQNCGYPREKTPSKLHYKKLHYNNKMKHVIHLHIGSGGWELKPPLKFTLLPAAVSNMKWRCYKIWTHTRLTKRHTIGGKIGG